MCTRRKGAEEIFRYMALDASVSPGIQRVACVAVDPNATHYCLTNDTGT